MGTSSSNSNRKVSPDPQSLPPRACGPSRSSHNSRTNSIFPNMWRQQSSTSTSSVRPGEIFRPKKATVKVGPCPSNLARIVELPPFPKKGVSLAFLRRIRDHILLNRSCDPHWTTNEVNENVIKPLTKDLQCSFDELYLNKYKDEPDDLFNFTYSQAYGEKATIFISHAWRYEFVELVEAIENYFDDQRKCIGQEDTDEFPQNLASPECSYFWIDLFLNNQWKAPLLPYEWWSGTFLSAIGEIGHTMLVLSPWDAPIPLTRAWCLWEIHCTLETNSKLTIQLSARQRQDFQRRLREDYASIMKAFCQLDVRKSEAASQSDQEMIFQSVERSKGGFRGVNNEIMEHIREWIAESARQIVVASLAVMTIPNESRRASVESVVCADQSVNDSDKKSSGNSESLTAGGSGRRIFGLNFGQNKKTHNCASGSVSPVMSMVVSNSSSRRNSLRQPEGTGKGAGVGGPNGARKKRRMSSEHANFQWELKRDEEEEAADQNKDKIPDESCGERKTSSSGCVRDDINDVTTTHVDQVLKTAAVILSSGGGGTSGKNSSPRKRCVEKEAAAASDQEAFAVSARADVSVTSRRAEGTPTKPSAPSRPVSLSQINRNELDDLMRLALVLKQQSKRKEAEELYHRALSGYEKWLGPNHPNTLRAMTGLGNLMLEEGDFKEAATYYHRVLERSEATLGLEHPDTLCAVSNVATLFANINRFEDAEKMFLRVLAGREIVLRVDHPDTLRTINNLANVYKKMRNYPEAEKMYNRALRGRELTLGSEHPDTLETICNMAGMLERQGKSNEARQLYERALIGREKTLGRNHPLTLWTTNSLAVIYHQQKKCSEAMALYEQVIQGRLETLGENHVDTLWTMNSFALLLHGMKKFPEAREMYTRVLEGRRRVLGAQHPDTLQVTDCLSKLQCDALS